MELELVPERYLALLKRARIRLIANIAILILSFPLVFAFSGFFSKLMGVVFLVSFVALFFTILSLYNTKDRLEHQKLFLKNDILIYAYFNEISENNGRMNYYVLKKPVRCTVYKDYLKIKGLFAHSSIHGDGQTMFEWQETADGQITYVYDTFLNAGKCKVMKVKVQKMYSKEDTKRILSHIRSRGGKVYNISLKNIIRSVTDNGNTKRN